MKLAIIATLPLLLSAPLPITAQQPPGTTKPAPAATPTQQRPGTTKPAPAPASTATATITVTDLSGAPIPEVRVTLTGGLDRSGSTQPNGMVRFDGLRPGTYRLKFEKEGFVVFEREIEVRAGQPPPNPSVALSPAPAPPPPPPPPPPAPTKSAGLPPPGKPITMAVPDYIERNFITSGQPQKTSNVGCSGLANTVLWQIREPWENRQHDGADAMLYVIGGEGALRLDGRDTPLQAGSFASVPRGMSYSLSRRGRNPLIILATLAGEPCAP